MKTGMKKMSPINIRFPDRVLTLLKERAALERRSVSSMAALLVEYQLESDDEKNKPKIA